LANSRIIDGVPTEPPNRAKILRAALHCIALYGPNRLSIAGVAQQAAVSRGTVYKYFANGDALIDAVAEYVRDRFGAGVAEAARHDDHGDVRARLVRIINARMDPETRDAVVRLRELQPTFTLEFVSAHVPDFVKVYEDALRGEFESADLLISLHDFAEIMCRIVISETLIMDDRARVTRLVLALWDSVVAASLNQDVDLSRTVG
jgi:AcrR family transcriptional regulator